MEGAEGLVLAPGGTELHELADDGDNGCRGEHLGDVVLTVEFASS
jgi:hypothetical protein